MFIISLKNLASLQKLADEIQNCIENCQQSHSQHNKKKNVQRLSQKLSDQIVYCQAVSWNEEFLRNVSDVTLRDVSKRNFRQMSSIGETKIQKYLE